MAHKDEIQHQVIKKMRLAFIAVGDQVIAEIEDSEMNVSGII